MRPLHKDELSSCTTWRRVENININQYQSISLDVVVPSQNSSSGMRMGKNAKVAEHLTYSCDPHAKLADR